MKHTINIFPLCVATLLVLGSLAGCSKSEPNSNNTDSKEISALVALGGSSVEAGSVYSSATQTKVTASGSEELSLNFVRADQTSASAYGDYQPAAITATRGAGTGNQPLTFNSMQYYLANGLNTKLTGWYPNGTYDGTARTVSWTIDGQQDVMTAPMQEGSREDIMPVMTFDHRLTQLQFCPYAETQSAVDAWGKIIKIEVLDQQNTVVYNLTNEATGAVSFSGEKSNDFSAGIAAEGASLSLSSAADKATNAKQMGSSVMIAPQSSSSYELKLRITTSNSKYKEVTLTQALMAGVPYRLYMNFKELDITIETTVAQWSEATISDKVGDLRIGDLKDGGLIYWIDQTNSQKYKVFSLDQGLSLVWSAQITYELGAAGQSNTDGKANVAAMKAYSLANTGNTDATKRTTGVFATDFPAANFCDSKNTDGVTGWYLPAKNELLALYSAYTANKTLLEKAITDNSGTDIPAGGVFWSSTEGTTTNLAWFVFFADGFASGGSKSTEDVVRCVREL